VKSAFGMFSLTKREQRAVVVIVLALVVFALVKHYRDVGMIAPAPTTQSPEMSATPPLSDQDRDAR
jgi:hypothetical protein